MTKQEEKICPHCGTTFQCNPGDITQCHCFGIILNNEEQQHICKQFGDCLCFNCVIGLKSAFNKAIFAGAT